MTILCVNHDLLNGNGLKLKLEHLAIDMAVAVHPLTHLALHNNLKSLCLELPNYSDPSFNLIFGLTNLEVLELNSYLTGSQSDRLNDLYRLENLKKLNIYDKDQNNILNNLRFGVHKSLEELDGCFSYNDDLEAIRDMKRITPKLKTIKIKFIDSRPINVLLETLENLEHLQLEYYFCDFPQNSVYPKMKHFELFPLVLIFEKVQKLVKTFPNLQRLIIKDLFINLTKSMLKTLLGELKQLEELKILVYTVKNNNQKLVQIHTKKCT